MNLNISNFRLNKHVKLINIVNSYLFMVKMGNNVPLSIQIEQFIKKHQDQKAQKQSFMDSLEIYNQDINTNKAQ